MQTQSIGGCLRPIAGVVPTGTAPAIETSVNVGSIKGSLPLNKKKRFFLYTPVDQSAARAERVIRVCVVSQVRSRQAGSNPPWRFRSGFDWLFELILNI